MVQIRRLNHAVLFVSDLERSVAFYEKAFGFSVIAREPAVPAAFLRAAASGNHHDLGLFQTRPGATRSGPGAVGLYHLAWEVGSIGELAEAQEQLGRLGALVGQSDHGATKSLYGVDPDGIEFEVMWMLPRESWGDYESAAPVAPLDLDAEVARWGG